jgi:predicted alpha/beta superfamily hydrolase
MRLFLVCLALVILPQASAAPTDSPVVQFGVEDTLHSQALGGVRTYWVDVPPTLSHDAGRAAPGYPVLYVLDAEWNFSWACQVAQFLADSQQIPGLIVVGVPNVDREKDLAPPLDAESGATPFEKFLSEELAPEIDAKFHPAPYRILAGHSRGGALVVDAFLRRLPLFQAYIAIDPSLWWNDKELVRRAADFSPSADSHTALFLVAADAPPGVDADESMFGLSARLAAELRSHAAPGIRIEAAQLAGEDHSSSRLRGLYDGLRFLFQGYKPQNVLVLNEPALVARHYKELSERLGFQVLPPERLVNNIGDALVAAHENAKAIACLKFNVNNYPTSAYAYNHLAAAYAADGSKELAIQCYEKALELDPHVDFARDALAKLKH